MRDYLLTEEQDRFLRILDIISAHNKRGKYAVGLKVQSKRDGMTFAVAIYDKTEACFVKQETNLTGLVDAEEIITQTLKDLKAL